MCNRLLIIMFILIHLMFIVVIAQQVKGKERNQRETVREISELRQDWMKEILNVNKELLDVQAVIAKDEESTTNCMTGTRKTNKRHLMCIGSIVNVQHVLTSATCIQEATYIRHNLKAPLVVVVGVLKSKPQVIRVNNYEIHPEHIAFPYNSQHSVHNIAVVKLACRIATEHFAPIELPNAPFTELCPNDNCMVAIIRKVGKTSNVIYDTWAKHIPLTRRKRGLTETTIELQNNNTFKTPPANIEEKLNEMLVAQRRVKLNAKQDILPNNINQTVTGFSKMEKSMPVKIAKEKRNFAIFHQLASEYSASSMASDNLDEHVFQNDSNRNNKVRLFSVRASDGFQGCPQTGSPVMFGRVQAALVSVSCDDRQPDTPWKYTDIYSNLDWIRKITGVLINDSVSRSPSDSVFGCTTCIYNFFIDLTGPNETLNCTDLDILTNNKFCASNYEKQDYSRSIISQKSRYSRLTENNQNQLNETKSNITNRKFQQNLRNQNFRNFLQRILKDKNLQQMKNNYNREELPKGGKNDKNYQIVTGKSNTEKNRKFMKLNKMIENMLKEEYFHKDNTNEKGIQSESVNRNFPNKSKNGNRLKKQVEIDKIPINEFDYSMMKTIKSQPSIDYNPLENKFHNLRMLLARLQKSMPAKEIRQTSMIGKPIRILPYGRIFNPTI